ncbi:hypothetical protein PUN4_350002 [Paraburkholderia unamae]|nr:hypothetical protein PUN4_350002 [Paraburkholderia unamae]
MHRTASIVVRFPGARPNARFFRRFRKAPEGGSTGARRAATKKNGLSPNAKARVNPAHGAASGEDDSLACAAAGYRRLFLCAMR